MGIDVATLINDPTRLGARKVLKDVLIIALGIIIR